MAKVYLLKETDFEDLLRRLDRRTPQHGPTHDVASVPADVQERVKREAFDDAHRFYVYQIQCWVNDVQK